MRAAFTFLTCLALTAAVTGTASAKTVWLCKPGLAENPCARSLTSTVVGADGSQTTERARRPRRLERGEQPADRDLSEPLRHLRRRRIHCCVG